jgi:hypothetical protein
MDDLPKASTTAGPSDGVRISQLGISTTSTCGAKQPHVATCLCFFDMSKEIIRLKRSLRQRQAEVLGARDATLDKQLLQSAASFSEAQVDKCCRPDHARILKLTFFLPGTPYTQTVNMVFHGFLWLCDGLTEKGLTDTAGSCGCQTEVSWNGCTPKSSIFWILHFRKLLNLVNELFSGRRNGYTTKATTCHGRSSLTLGCRFTKSRDVTRAKLLDLGQWSPLDEILLGYIGIDGSTMTSTLTFFSMQPIFVILHPYVPFIPFIILHITCLFYQQPTMFCVCLHLFASYISGLIAQLLLESILQYHHPFRGV